VKRRKGSQEPGLFGSEPAGVAETRSEEDEALLEQLAQLVLEGDATDGLESRFRRRQPELHFSLRTRFGSYGNAVAVLLKQELGNPLGRRQVLHHLQERYAAGEPITLESVVLSEPRLAQAIIREFGSLRSSLEELHIDPGVAEADRRWDRERVFLAVLELLGDAVGELDSALLDSQVPLLAEVVRLQFGSFNTFHKEFSLWVESQPAVFLLWGRNGLSRVLARNVPVTSRATKGRNLADVQRVKLCYAARPGYRLCMLTSEGMLYPLDTAGVPFVSFGAGESKAAARIPNLARGEKPLALVSMDEREGFLAMASHAGRMKVVSLKQIKRVRAQGTRVMKLATGDSVVAGTVLSADYQRLVAVTRAGRGVAFQRELIKVSSRASMGVFRLRSGDERGGEAVSLFGVREGEHVVLLGRNGNLLRIHEEEIPSRKGVSLGRRLWRTPVVAASACPDPSRLLVATKRGRLLCFWDAQVPQRQAMRIGVMGIRLDADDSPEMLCIL
jgi:hypothetical protein